MVDLLDRVTADIVVVDKVGGSGNVESGCRGILHTDGLPFEFYLAIGLYQHLALCFQTGLDTFMVCTIHDSRHHINLSVTLGNDRNDFRRQWTIKTEVERKGFLL